MYIFKNSLVSISRNRGRNFLIAIIVIVIAAASAITLAIRNSAIKIVTAYEEKYEVEATIGMDRVKLIEELRGENNSQEKMIGKFNNIKSITLDEINNYGNSEYVKKYYYYYETSMNAKNLKEATDSLVKETTKTETTTETETFQRPPQPRPDGKFKDGGSYGSKKTTTKVTTQIEKILNEKAQNGAFGLVGYSSLESMTDFISGNKVITD